MWSSGDVVVYRHRGRSGRYLFGKPLTIVESTPDAIVAHMPAGTEIARPVLEDGSDPRTVPVPERWGRPPVPARRLWTGSDVVMIFPRGRAHSLWVFQGPESPGWYVNLEQPHVFGERTISTHDHVLDVWVPAETGEPRWKDEHELEVSVAAGRLTVTQAAAIRAEGERVIRERPWPTGWEEFAPDRSWPLPELFDGWDVP